MNSNPAKPYSDCSEPAILTGISVGGAARAQAIHCLYARYFAGIRNYVVRNSGNLADAEDVFQETLVLLLQQVLDKKTEIRRLDAWINTVGRRQWLMVLRRRKTEATRGAGWSPFPDTAEEPQLPLLPGEDNDPLTRFYLDCLHQLDEKKRAILIDFFGNDVRQEALAAKYGYSGANSLKQLIGRWKNELRECVERKLKLR